MRVAIRVAIAFVLVSAILLVKRHLDTLGDYWHSAKAGAADHFVGDAHIELVSTSRTSSTQYFPTPAPSRSWPQPTKPSLPKPISEPEQIPVDVPEPETYDWYLDDYLADLNFDLDSEEEEQRPAPTPRPKPNVKPMDDRVIVLGKMSWEDTEWLDYELPEWQHAVYTVDDPSSDLTVQENKGKESNVYLQYIIDHYDKLPEYMVFLHAHQYAYHVEFKEQDNALAVQRLQLDYVKKVGYANLRCDWGPGCPNEVQPFRQMGGRTTEIAFAGAWMGIFNNSDIPDEIGTPCCAQFIVTREQVQARPLSDYQHYHSWLLETQLDDDTSGRVFEYLWHIIFGQDAVSCQEKEQCYWDLYGMDHVEPLDLESDDSWDSLPFLDNDENLDETNDSPVGADENDLFDASDFKSNDAPFHDDLDSKGASDSPST